MSLIYKPLNGDAGKIVCRLYDASGQQQTQSVTLYITNFSEELVESELNSEFLNNAGYYTQDHYGWHQTITFSLINALSGDSGVLGSTNQANIVTLVSWVNLIKMFPKQYRLEIDYRTGELTSTIQNAQYIGGYKLEEISKNSNTGQIVTLSFREKYYTQINLESSLSINLIEAETSTSESRVVFIGEESDLTNNYIYIHGLF